MSDIPGESDDRVVTVDEFLEEVEDREEEAVAVLGGSDSANCSYSEGYVKRQALYACLTCNPPTSPEFQNAGVCLACSYKCHDGHNLVELYTKRNFRCDCGNTKFSGNPCQLQPNKDGCNDLNEYNQNFKGVYCTCQRPYPDPENLEDDEMFQCIMCEDWYHLKHCKVQFDSNNEEADNFEMICGQCVSIYDFLEYYSAEFEFKDRKTVDVETVESDIPEASSSEDRNPEEGLQLQAIRANVTDTGSVEEQEVVKKCRLMTVEKSPIPGGIVLRVNWRKNLCQCDNCLEKYKTLKVSFLLDEDYTIQKYEAVGKAREASAELKSEENLQNILDSLGHVGKIEVIQGYNEMKEEMKTFFARYAEEGKVICTQDVQDFFEIMRAKKRRRLNDNIPPGYCH